MKLCLVLLTLTGILALSIYHFIKFGVKKSDESALNYLEENSSSIRDFDYIVIFGAKINDAEPSNELRARIDFALKIWRMNKRAKFIITGGDKNPNDEQAVVYEYLKKQGVSLELLLKLKNSDTTRNTIKSLLLQNREFENCDFLAITSSFHAKRIELESKKNNVTISVSAPRHSPEIENIKVHKIRIVVEIIAILFYLLPDQLTRYVKTNQGTFRHTIPKFFIKLVSSRAQAST